MSAPANSSTAPIQQTDAALGNDPTATPAQQPTVAPTPSGQMPDQSQSPAPQTQQPQVSQNVGQQQPLQNAPAGSTQAAQPEAPHNRLLRIARDITNSMYPGPLVNTAIDPATGQATRTEQPVTAKSIGLAIALEALTGAAAGAGARGPGATGQAAAAGLAQGQQIAQQHAAQQAQLDQQAKDDLNTKFQTVKNGYMLMTQARALSKADEQDHIDAEAQALPLYTAANKMGAIVADNLEDIDALNSEKYPVTEYDRYLVGHHAATDADGNPLYMIPGSGRIVPKDTPGAIPKLVNTWAISDRHRFDMDEDGQNLPFWNSQIARGGVLGNGNGRVVGKLSSVQVQGLQVKDAVTNAAMSDINRVRADQGQPALNLDSTMKKNGSLQDALGLFQTQLGVNGHQYAGALQAVQAKYPDSAAIIAQSYGGIKALQKLDLTTAQHDQDNKFRVNGVDDDKSANQALNSTSPDVKKMGQDYYVNKRTQKKQEEQDAANIRVGADERVERFKNNLASGPGGANSPAASEAPNAQGVRANYLASLPDDQRGTVQAIGEGRMAPPNVRTKEGKALADLVTTAYPTYNGANFQTYQTAKTKATTGSTGDSIKAANTAIDHVTEMTDNAQALSVLPGAGFAARKGMFGPQAQQHANNFQIAQHGVSEEVGKAVKGGILTAAEAKEWQSEIQGWTPDEVKTKGIALVNLLKDRIDEQQDILNKASVTGVAPFTVMSAKAQRNYERLTGQTQGGSQGQPQLTNFQTNPQTGQRIGWNGTTWVDAKTNQPVGGR